MKPHDRVANVKERVEIGELSWDDRDGRMGPMLERKRPRVMKEK